MPIGNRLVKRPKLKNKIDNFEEIDSESESAAIKHSAKKNDKKWLYTKKYDGTTPLALFFTNVESCAAYNDWTENDKFAHVRLSLVGTAAHTLSGGIIATPTYSNLAEKLKVRFGTKDQSVMYRSQLKGRRRQKNESLYNVYDDIIRLVLLAYPGEQSVHRDDFGVGAFIEALDDYQLELRFIVKILRN